MCFCGFFKRLFGGSDDSEDFDNMNVPPNSTQDVRRPSIKILDEFDAEKPQQNSNTTSTNVKSTNLTVESEPPQNKRRKSIFDHIAFGAMQANVSVGMGALDYDSDDSDNKKSRTKDVVF